MTDLRDKINDETMRYILPLLEEIITDYGAHKIVLDELVPQKYCDVVTRLIDQEERVVEKWTLKLESENRAKNRKRDLERERQSTQLRQQLLKILHDRMIR